MFLRIYCITLIIILFAIKVSCTCLSSSKTKACQAVFNPDAMKMSCCPPMNLFVDRIAQCQKKSNSAVFACPVSLCVLTVYGLLTNGKVDEDKAKALLVTLTNENAASKPLNDEIYNNCLNGQYLKYVTSDPKCDYMKYQVCAFVNYLLGCQKFNSSPSSCKTLSQNVATCKPVLAQYLNDIYSKSC